MAGLFAKGDMNVNSGQLAGSIFMQRYYILTRRQAGMFLVFYLFPTVLK